MWVPLGWKRGDPGLYTEVEKSVCSVPILRWSDSGRAESAEVSAAIGFGCVWAAQLEHCRMADAGKDIRPTCLLAERVERASHPPTTAPDRRIGHIQIAA
jgi:hypothetical protein